MNKIEHKYAGAAWLRAQKITDEISELGENVADMLGVVFHGLYHLENKCIKRVDWSNPIFIEFRYHGALATFDNSLLTYLVMLAHDMGIRVCIAPHSPRFINIQFHAYEPGKGFLDGHPDFEYINKLRSDNYEVEIHTFCDRGEK